MNASAPSRSLHRRNALLCACIVGSCVLLTVPFLAMAVNDDFSYTKSAFDFARTGDIVYNGWATAMLGWQIIWGAIFAKMSSYSFTAVRLSTLPFATGSVSLLYVMLARFGVNTWNATWGALTLGLSPLYIPLSASFMTDIPAVFCILLCFYMCQRAVQSSSDCSAVAWLVAATACNVLDGTIRQIVWLGAIVIIPSAVWLRRSDRLVVRAGLLMWLLSVIVISTFLHWYREQPYTLPTSVLPEGPESLFSFLCFARLCFFGLTVMLFTLPLTVSTLSSIPALSSSQWVAARRALLYLGALLTIVAMRLPLRYLIGPWLPDTVTQYGMMQLADVSPLTVLIPMWVRVAFMLLLICCVAALCGVISRHPMPHIRGHAEASTPLYQAFALTAPFSLAYIGLLVLRAPTTFGLFDRYVLLLLPVFILLFVLYYQSHVRERLPSSSVAMIVLWGAYSVMATHDFFAVQRARLRAAEEVEHAGIPRTQIHGFLEYDAWTQLVTQGHINDMRITKPAGVYHVAPHLHAPPEECRFWLADELPSVHPKYIVVFQPNACFENSQFSPVTYRLWLPPFHAKVYVQKQRDGFDWTE